MTVASKNSVVVGYVAYFVGLSLLGLAIYLWSKPRLETAHPGASALQELQSTGARVEYEAVEGAALETVAAPAESVAPSVDPQPSAAPAADEEWK